MAPGFEQDNPLLFNGLGELALHVPEPQGFALDKHGELVQGEEFFGLVEAALDDSCKRTIQILSEAFAAQFDLAGFEEQSLEAGLFGVALNLAPRSEFVEGEAELFHRGVSLGGFGNQLEAVDGVRERRVFVGALAKEGLDLLAEAEGDIEFGVGAGGVGANPDEIL
jgi:hypothetical protein